MQRKEHNSVHYVDRGLFDIFAKMLEGEKVMKSDTIQRRRD
jgi:hypothetical protein